MLFSQTMTTSTTAPIFSNDDNKHNSTCKLRSQFQIEMEGVAMSKTYRVCYEN